MTKIDSNLACPSCQGPLEPKVLGCDACNLKVEGPFQLNEFATLAPDDLHFLRIFIRCEGRIRDMEPALGLSYPTIRNRLTDLKNKLIADGETEPVVTEDSSQDVLAQLEAGKISFDVAMKKIKSAKTRGGKK